MYQEDREEKEEQQKRASSTNKSSVETSQESPKVAGNKIAEVTQVDAKFLFRRYQ